MKQILFIAVALLTAISSFADDAQKLYKKGIKCEQSGNLSEAVDFYKKSADMGYHEAQFLLGYYYEVGKGVMQDGNMAVKYYEKAASHNNSEAMNNLGAVYEFGKAGIPINYLKAEEWYKKSANLKYANAMNNLGALYFRGTKSGRGINKGYAEAMRWFVLAAEAGSNSGMANVAKMYDEGIGVEQNDSEALQWYRKALNAGDTSVKDDVTRLENKVFPPKVKKIATDYLRNHM